GKHLLELFVHKYADGFDKRRQFAKDEARNLRRHVARRPGIEVDADGIGAECRGSFAIRLVGDPTNLDAHATVHVAQFSGPARLLQRPDTPLTIFTSS